MASFWEKNNYSLYWHSILFSLTYKWMPSLNEFQLISKAVFISIVAMYSLCNRNSELPNWIWKNITQVFIFKLVMSTSSRTMSYNSVSTDYRVRMRKERMRLQVWMRQNLVILSAHSSYFTYLNFGNYF